jgi:adenylylsulfate kinase-like enzyme
MTAEENPFHFYYNPQNPEIIINTAKQDIDSSVAKIMDFLV